jgi:hypothetical protein
VIKQLDPAASPTGRGALKFADAGAAQKGSNRKAGKERSSRTLLKVYFLLYRKLIGSIRSCSSLLILLTFSQKTIYREVKGTSL